MPVGVEFITDSISQRGLAAVQEIGTPRNHPLSALVIHDLPDGSMECALNTTILHGVRSALVLKETGDAAAVRAARNLDVSPRLVFTDWRGHGYGPSSKIKLPTNGLRLDNDENVIHPLERHNLPFPFSTDGRTHSADTI